jgi:hypothetical protein
MNGPNHANNAKIYIIKEKKEKKRKKKSEFEYFWWGGQTTSNPKRTNPFGQKVAESPHLPNEWFDYPILYSHLRVAKLLP